MLSCVLIAACLIAVILFVGVAALLIPAGNEPGSRACREPLVLLDILAAENGKRF